MIDMSAAAGATYVKVGSTKSLNLGTGQVFGMGVINQGQANSITGNSIVVTGNYNQIQSNNSHIVGDGNYVAHDNVTVFGNNIIATQSNTVYINQPVILGPNGTLPISNTSTPETMAFFNSTGVLSPIWSVNESINSFAGGGNAKASNWGERSWSSIPSGSNGDHQYGTLMYSIIGQPWNTTTGTVDVFLDNSSQVFTPLSGMYSFTLNATLTTIGTLGANKSASSYTTQTFILMNVGSPYNGLVQTSGDSLVTSITFNSFNISFQTAIPVINDHDIIINYTGPGGSMGIQTKQNSYFVIGTYDLVIKLDYIHSTV